MAKIIRLKDTGSFEGDTKSSSDLSYIDKQCLMVYCGKFDSMDGEVEIKDEDIEKLASNHNGMLAKLSRMASGEHHPKHNPPVQLDHSTSARDTVGRLRGDLTVGEHTNHEGNKVKALFGSARILGKENVEKVMDGRWTNLSGGFDLEDHKVSELTITPFPAAGDASLLSRKRLGGTLIEQGEHKDCPYTIYTDDSDQIHWSAANHDGIVTNKAEAIKCAKAAIDKFIESDPDGLGRKKLTKLQLTSGEDIAMGYKETKEKAEMYGKCKKHLMDEKKMSEEDADKHLESAKDEELKKMAADHDEKEAKMAKEESDKKDAEMKRMGALKEHKTKFVELSKGMRATGVKVQLASKKAGIIARLSKLQAETKITPAERKGMNLDELAGKSDEVISATLSSYEKREPVIDVGMYGSTKALSPVQLKKKVKEMGAEVEELKTRLGMSTKRADALKRLGELGLTESDLEKGVQIQTNKGDKGDDVDFEASYATMKKLIGEGKDDEAKAHFKSHMGSGQTTETVGPDQSAEMSSLAEEHKKMQTNFDEIVKLAAPVFGATAEELA